MTAGWCSRTGRAAVFAAVCVVLAALGHVLMAEAAVAWWALVAGAAAVGGAAWLVAGRERGLHVVVPFTVAAQTALHAWFSFTQTAVSPAPSPSMPAHTYAMEHGSHAMEHGSPSMPMSHSGHGMDGTAAMGHGMDGMDTLASAGHGMAGMSSTGMLAAHLLAALLCGLWLAHGERAAFRVLRALAGWLVAPLRLLLRLPAPPHRPRVRARRGDSARAPRRLLLTHAITTRGPPVGTAVA
ncbi:hypothetical protein [Streptomyces sp. WAC04114]|uniref:hypothetical protein n=1 Tax=Streptomyces sp. WAC04114 TaxID=2867961 RepID=UPI001C8B4884|nr:hypothetical protein [Streptomyces sp. WAC04114]MBX9365915.1 hypothetical protein [Streptomyces sp. WAC04114]